MLRSSFEFTTYCPDRHVCDLEKRHRSSLRRATTGNIRQCSDRREILRKPIYARFSGKRMSKSIRQVFSQHHVRINLCFHWNRFIYDLYVRRADAFDPQRMLVNSFLHPLELVTVPTTMYAMHRLAVSMVNLRTPYAALLSNVPLMFVPVVSRDGHVITSTSDQLWRKNARAGSTCDGVDPKRDWDFNVADLTELPLLSAPKSTGVCPRPMRSTTIWKTPCAYRCISTSTLWARSLFARGRTERVVRQFLL